MATSSVSPTRSPVDTGAEVNERHSRKCLICRHPDRDAIEEEFLHWHRVVWIAREYQIPDHRSIYRQPAPWASSKPLRAQAHAPGYDARRGAARIFAVIQLLILDIADCGGAA